MSGKIEAIGGGALIVPKALPLVGSSAALPRAPGLICFGLKKPLERKADHGGGYYGSLSVRTLACECSSRGRSHTLKTGTYYMGPIPEWNDFP